MGELKFKICGYCKQELPVEQFYKSKTHTGGVSWGCKKCSLKTRASRFKYDPELRKNAALRDTFGINLEQYRKMLVEQHGVCAICFKPETATHKGKIKNLAVDHDHVNGNVRGLLCNDCNVGLGWFKDDVQSLQSAIRYLESKKKK